MLQSARCRFHRQTTFAARLHYEEPHAHQRATFNVFGYRLLEVDLRSAIGMTLIALTLLLLGKPPWCDALAEITRPSGLVTSQTCPLARGNFLYSPGRIELCHGLDDL